MEWPEIRMGTGEEALVNTHEQSLSLAVSAEGATIKRRDKAEPLSHWVERHWFGVHLSFSSERLLSRVEPGNTQPFSFPSFSLIQTDKSTM